MGKHWYREPETFEGIVLEGGPCAGRQTIVERGAAHHDALVEPGPGHSIPPPPKPIPRVERYVRYVRTGRVYGGRAVFAAEGYGPSIPAPQVVLQGFGRRHPLLEAFPGGVAPALHDAPGP